MQKSPKQVITRRIYLVFVASLTAVITGFTIERLFGYAIGSLFGHTRFGHLTGWLGFGVILLVFVYPIRKRFVGKSAWPKYAYWLHQIAGILGPVIIFVHSGSHFHALVPLVTLIAMMAVVISGISGVYVHRKALKLLNETRTTLSNLGYSQESIELQLFELAADEKMFRHWKAIHIPMSLLFITLAVTHIVGALYWGGF